MTESEMPEYKQRKILEAYFDDVSNLVKDDKNEISLILASSLDVLLDAIKFEHLSQQAQALAQDWVTVINRTTDQTYATIFQRINAQYNLIISLNHPDNDTLSILMRLLRILFVAKSETRQLDHAELNQFVKANGLWNSVLLLKNVCDDLIGDPDPAVG